MQAPPAPIIPEPPIEAHQEKPQPELVAVAPVPVAHEKPKSDKEMFGTAIQFERNPTEAAKVATKEGKLLFLLHVSGNFEECDFT